MRYLGRQIRYGGRNTIRKPGAVSCQDSAEAIPTNYHVRVKMSGAGTSVSLTMHSLTRHYLAQSPGKGFLPLPPHLTKRYQLPQNSITYQRLKSHFEIMLIC